MTQIIVLLSLIIVARLLSRKETYPWVVLVLLVRALHQLFAWLDKVVTRVDNRKCGYA